jgi:hypothetical protein
MTSTYPVDVDMASESDLSSLTGVTPTDPFDEPVEIKAMLTAADDAAYDLQPTPLLATNHCPGHSICHI